MAVFTVTGKITNLSMRLNETTSDVFYDQPEIYLKCIKAGAKYLRKEPYPENNQDIKFKYGYHPEKVTNREKWWANALKPIKAELKDHYGPGFTKKIKGIVWTLADEGNTALENMKQFISTGTCEQYEAFVDGTPNSSDAGGLYIDDEEVGEHDPNMVFIDEESWNHFGESWKPICQNCGAPLTKEEVETYGDTCEACALDDIGRDRNYDGPDVGDLFESIIRENNDFDVTDQMLKSLGWKMTVRDACTCGWNSVRVYGEDGIAFYSSRDNTFIVDCYDGSDDEFLDMEVQLDDFWQEDEDGYPIVYGTKLLQEGTNTEKKNYIDIKGEKAPLDWDRIDDKIEKVGFGKDLYECIIRESEIKSWYEPFLNFYYQIYNGGVGQPIGLNPGYYKAVDELLSFASHNDILAEIYEEKHIPEEVKPLFEEFVRNVIEVCEAVSSTTFYKPCEYCGGSGEEYVMDEDEDGNDHSYYDTCINCGGDGEVQCNYDEVDDPDDIKSYLNLEAKRAWDELENKCSEYQKMFKVIEGKE